MRPITVFILSATLALTLATLAISPNDGSFTSPVSVTMQTATAGASIFYTTNSSTPTHPSTLYTGAITLASSAAVKAKAFKSGYIASPEASASFTVSQPQRAGIAKGVIRYADNATLGKCSNGGTNYNPATRTCGSGSDIVYTGNNAIENASKAAAATDQIHVRSGGARYVGTGNSPFQCVTPRAGTSPSNRHVIRGYQNETPRVLCFYGGNSVHIYGFLVDGTGSVHDSIGFMGFTNSRIGEFGFTTEIFNHGQQGMLFIDHSELINLNVHHNGFNSPDQCQLPGGVGVGQCHGVYAEDTLLIDGGEYHHNEGFGIHCYRHCRNTTIRNLRAYANNPAGVGVFNDQPNPRVEVYNVVAHNNRGYGVAASAEGVYYNITAVSNGVAPVRHGMLGTIKKSILLGGYNTKTFNSGTGAFLGNSTAFNNITSGNASSYLVDPANGNFTSTVKGIGADLSRPIRVIIKK